MGLLASMGLSPFHSVGAGPEVAAPMRAAGRGAGVAGGRGGDLDGSQHQLNSVHQGVGPILGAPAGGEALQLGFFVVHQDFQAHLLEGQVPVW